jgi:hypothetical protein
LPLSTTRSARRAISSMQTAGSPFTSTQSHEMILVFQALLERGAALTHAVHRRVIRLVPSAI